MGFFKKLFGGQPEVEQITAEEMGALLAEVAGAAAFEPGRGVLQTLRQSKPDLQDHLSTRMEVFTYCLLPLTLIAREYFPEHLKRIQSSMASEGESFFLEMLGPGAGSEVPQGAIAQHIHGRLLSYVEADTSGATLEDLAHEASAQLGGEDGPDPSMAGHLRAYSVSTIQRMTSLVGGYQIVS